MLGWDVGYVWPLLEGAVVSRGTPHIAMGNPRDVVLHAQDGDGSSAATAARRIEHRAPIPGSEPPPYENTGGFGEPVPEAPIAAQNRGSLRDPPTCQASVEFTTTPFTTRRNATDLGLFRLPRWPHNASSTLACLSCVLGMYNISRFSMLAYIYKASFIIQFLLLSLVIGIPVLYFQMALGQYLGAGLLDMWYISPAFKGLGFAMLYIYVVLGIYNAVPLSWLFVYFKDSFITLKDSYRWGRCHFNFARSNCLKALNSSSSDYYGWSVPSYFHGRVLGRRPGEFHFGELKFEVAFNLCLVWLIIFVCLSRGPKTLGKVVYLFGSLPVVLLMMVTMRMGQQWSEGIKDLFAAPWKTAFLDSSTWLLAAREVFLTWGVLSCVALHVCSRNKLSTNITKTLIFVAVSAIVVLLMSAFLFSCTAHALFSRNLLLAGSSYEEEWSVRVLKPGGQPRDNLTVAIMVLGESIVSTDNVPNLSGYQVLRLATEVFPAALAVEGVRSISSFWSICFYAAMIMFGLGQQAVLWYCVVESVIAINYKVFKAWHTTLTFITCNLAFLLGLPLTSNIGIYIIYYFDFCIGLLWWIVMLYLIAIFAVLFIRGRPCGTDQLVNMISRQPSTRSWVLPLLTFQWNVVLPVTLLILVISFLKSGSADSASVLGKLSESYSYWPQWAKTLILVMQMLPLLLILAVCAYQAYRIFSEKADLPFNERLKYLCCPALPIPPMLSRQSLQSNSSNFRGSTNSAFVDDPPPKYTPPPSYSTATSRMLAKKSDAARATNCSIDLDNMEDDDLSTIEEDVFAPNYGSESRRESILSHFSEPRTNHTSPCT